MKLRLRWLRGRREREHRILRRLATGFFVVGILALGICALAYLSAVVSQALEQHEFESSLNLPSSARFDAHAKPPAASVSRLEIPRLGLSVMVHEGVGSRILQIGAGHIPGTAPPGDFGNIGIAAHRDTFFRKLRSIRRDDAILLDTLDGTYQYAVEWTRVVKPSDLQVLASSEQPVLTLVTCYPFYYVGPAPNRFIVRARRVTSGGTIQPLPFDENR